MFRPDHIDISKKSFATAEKVELVISVDGLGEDEIFRSIQYSQTHVQYAAMMHL